MHFNGSASFAADRRHVWDVLIDPSNVGQCAPVPIVRVDDTHFRSQAKIGSGLFSATFVTNVELAELDAERHASLVAHGRGSGTTIEATTSFDLRDGETAGFTVVDWAADLELGGMFAGPGTKIIQERAPEAIRQLVDCLRRQVEGGTP
ncbi:MAG TPA: SRPBCC domain-containing protein [Candidatus Saccharimonadales bacterium]|nr:SRPBCC domain-containing protein [Candidatus Saccharimonadales bacterium]